MTREPVTTREDVEAYLYRILGRRPRANETQAFTSTNRALNGANTDAHNDIDTHAQEVQK